MKNINVPKINMNINNRDMKLLGILFSVIIAFLIYYFLISPSWDKMNSLRMQDATLKGEINIANESINNLQSLKAQDLTEKTRLVLKYKPFFNEFSTERILYNFDTLMTASGFQPDSFTVNSAVVSQIIMDKTEFAPLNFPLKALALIANPQLIEKSKNGNSNNTDNNSNLNQMGPVNSQNNAKAPATDQVPGDSVAEMDITLGFTAAGYQNIMTFVKYTESMNKSIILKSINFSKSKDSTGIDGEIVFSLYSLPKVDNSEADYLKFLPQIPRGKVNPFN